MRADDQNEDDDALVDGLLYDDVEKSLVELKDCLLGMMEDHIDDVVDFICGSILMQSASGGADGCSSSTATVVKSCFGMTLSLLEAYLIQTFEKDDSATSELIMSALARESFYERSFSFAVI